MHYKDLQKLNMQDEYVDEITTYLCVTKNYLHRKSSATTGVLKVLFDKDVSFEPRTKEVGSFCLL